jgi:Leucine-rich repeat (LRR) protein
MSDAEMEDQEYEGEPEGEENEADLVVGVPLTKDICAKALSRLERVGNGSEFAYVKFNGSQLELNDISLLSEYVHLRYIYLSSNQINDILPLSNIKQLLTVILDRNTIESFNLPKMEFLQLADLSYNKINTFDGLDHPRLKCLNLNHNKLCNLDTMLMDTFVNLQVLELRANQFQSLKASTSPSSCNVSYKL